MEIYLEKLENEEGAYVASVYYPPSFFNPYPTLVSQYLVRDGEEDVLIHKEYIEEIPELDFSHIKKRDIIDYE